MVSVFSKAHSCTKRWVHPTHRGQAGTIDDPTQMGRHTAFGGGTSTPTDPQGMWVGLLAAIYAGGWAKMVFTVLLAGDAVVFLFVNIRVRRGDSRIARRDDKNAVLTR